MAYVLSKKARAEVKSRISTFRADTKRRLSQIEEKTDWNTVLDQNVKDYVSNANDSLDEIKRVVIPDDRQGWYDLVNSLSSVADWLFTIKDIFDDEFESRQTGSTLSGKILEDFKVLAKHISHTTGLSLEDFEAYV